MTEEAKTEPVKARRGWPAGKPRGQRMQVKPMPEHITAAADRAMAMPRAKNLLATMKSRPNWEGEDFVGVGLDGVDRLKIPKDVIESLHRDGVALQWVTKSVRGQEMPQELSKMTRGGWTPVHQSDFDGLLDGMFLSKGIDDVITVDDCMLVARPVEIHQKARMAERREASRPLQIAEEQLGHGIPGVTGSNHPTATRGNTIKKSMERVEIPE
jgi:hypothetical protein